MTAVETLTCTRSSTPGSALEDKTGMFPWSACVTMQTVFRHPDLRNRAALIDSPDWRDYKPLYQEADQRRGKPEAGHGTAIHGALQALHLGRSVAALDTDVVRAAEAAMAALETLRLTIVASEENVVTLGLPEPCAGTRDILAVDEYGRHIVVDLKTTASLGGAKFRALSWSIQLAIYAHGQPYGEPEYTRDRWGRPIVRKSLILPEERTVSHEDALVIEVERGTGRVEVHSIDIAQGWVFAELACRVRAARKADVIRSRALAKA